MDPETSNASTIVGAPTLELLTIRWGRAKPTRRKVSPSRKSAAGTERRLRDGARATFGSIAGLDQAPERRARRDSSAA